VVPPHSSVEKSPILMMRTRSALCREWAPGSERGLEVHLAGVTTMLA
jgi:hypothetical protein